MRSTVLRLPSTSKDSRTGAGKSSLVPACFLATVGLLELCHQGIISDSESVSTE